MSVFERMQISPFCVHLCSKKLVFQTHPPRTEGEILDASGHTWCEQSQETIGLDGEACCPQSCRVGRACFESYGGPSA